MCDDPAKFKPCSWLLSQYHYEQIIQNYYILFFKNWPNCFDYHVLRRSTCFSSETVPSYNVIVFTVLSCSIVISTLGTFLTDAKSFSFCDFFALRYALKQYFLAHACRICSRALCLIPRNLLKASSIMAISDKPLSVMSICIGQPLKFLWRNTPDNHLCLGRFR